MAGAPTDWQLGCTEMKQRGSHLLQSEQWSDCTFLVGTEPNQMVVPGHKLILAMASPVFEAMFFGGMAERNDPISILDVQPEAFKAILEYIYTDNINISSFDKACGLCFGVKKYMLPHLVTECIRYIWLHLYPRNACRAYEFAKLFEENVLMEKCIQIISTFTQEVLNDPSFEEVELNTVITVFSLDHLNIDSELDLFDAAARYAEAQELNIESSAESSAGSSPESAMELCKNAEPQQTNPGPSSEDEKSKGDNERIGKDKPTIRSAIEKIRFLTLTATAFAAGPARSPLLSESEAFAVLMNILSSAADTPMPRGFSTCRVPRKQLIGGEPSNTNIMAGAPTDWQLGCTEIKQRGSHLLQSEQWSDCTFLVGTEPNQTVVSGHKLILAMASPVFEAMFFGGMAERNDPISILDVQPEAFKALLEYIYTDNINISSFDKACGLCYGARKYMLPHLVKECTRYLLSDLYPRNACRAYEFARLFEENVLMEKCIQIISTYTQEVLNDPSFEEVELNTVITVFSLDHLNIDSELDLFDAAARYAKAQELNIESSAESSAGSSPESAMELCKTAEPQQTNPGPSSEDEKSKGDNERIGKDKPTIRSAIEKIRFLTLTATAFAAGPARSPLLSESEAFAVLMNILSSAADTPMPRGFSTCRVPRKQLIGGEPSNTMLNTLADPDKPPPLGPDAADEARRAQRTLSTGFMDWNTCTIQRKF